MVNSRQVGYRVGTFEDSGEIWSLQERPHLSGNFASRHFFGGGYKSQHEGPERWSSVKALPWLLSASLAVFPTILSTVLEGAQVSPG